MTIDEIEGIILQKDITQMLKEFNGDLVLVDKDYIPKQNERLIAYRIFITIDDYDDGIEIDSDFHFKFKDYGQKKWFEKTGFVGKIRSCSLNDWTSGIWEYDSEVVYFKLLIGERI